MNPSEHSIWIAKLTVKKRPLCVLFTLATPSKNSGSPPKTDGLQMILSWNFCGVYWFTGFSSQYLTPNHCCDDTIAFSLNGQAWKCTSLVSSSGARLVLWNPEEEDKGQEAFNWRGPLKNRGKLIQIVVMGQGKYCTWKQCYKFSHKVPLKPAKL